MSSSDNAEVFVRRPHYPSLNYNSVTDFDLERAIEAYNSFNVCNWEEDSGTTILKRAAAIFNMRASDTKNKGAAYSAQDRVVMQALRCAVMDYRLGKGNNVSYEALMWADRIIKLLRRVEINYETTSVELDLENQPEEHPLLTAQDMKHMIHCCLRNSPSGWIPTHQLQILHFLMLKHVTNLETAERGTIAANSWSLKLIRKGPDSAIVARELTFVYCYDYVKGIGSYKKTVVEDTQKTPFTLESSVIVLTLVLLQRKGMLGKNITALDVYQGKKDLKINSKYFETAKDMVQKLKKADENSGGMIRSRLVFLTPGGRDRGYVFGGLIDMDQEETEASQSPAAVAAAAPKKASKIPMYTTFSCSGKMMHRLRFDPVGTEDLTVFGRACGYKPLPDSNQFGCHQHWETFNEYNKRHGRVYVEEKVAAAALDDETTKNQEDEGLAADSEGAACAAVAVICEATENKENNDAAATAIGAAASSAAKQDSEKSNDDSKKTTDSLTAKPTPKPIAPAYSVATFFSPDATVYDEPLPYASAEDFIRAQAMTPSLQHKCPVPGCKQTFFYAGDVCQHVTDTLSWIPCETAVTATNSKKDNNIMTFEMYRAHLEYGVQHGLLLAKYSDAQAKTSTKDDDKDIASPARKKAKTCETC